MYQSFIKPFSADIKKFILDTLFPVTCLSCGKEGVLAQNRAEGSGAGLICDVCQSTLMPLESQMCIVCKKPSPAGLTHPLCLSPRSADGLISFFNYHDEKVSKILINGKYSFLPNAYRILGRLLAKKIQAHYEMLAVGCLLVPVPLHKWRLRWRGFNQSEILCQTLAHELNLPNANVLVRCKSTKVQKDLKKEQRLKNVEGSFQLSVSAKINGQNIILVDDFTTTGSTLQEAARVLKRNGAAKVICLTVARD